MNPPHRTDLLAQITQIQHMERGKLTAYHFKDRPAGSGPYFKLQCWENGKNVTRHVPAEQVPLLEDALAGYAKFQELTEQYAQAIIGQTRQELLTVGVKKKKPGPHPSSSWPRNKRSPS